MVGEKPMEKAVRANMYLSILCQLIELDSVCSLYLEEMESGVGFGGNVAEEEGSSVT